MIFHYKLKQLFVTMTVGMKMMKVIPIAMMVMMGGAGAG